MFTNKRANFIGKCGGVRILARLTRFAVVSSTILCVVFAHVHAQQARSTSSNDLFRQIVASVKRGDFTAALSLSTLVLRSAPNDHRIWTLRGMAYSGLQKKAQALIAFEHALKIAPYYLPAVEGEAQLKYQQGNDGARPFLLRVLTVLPNDPTTHGMLAVLDYRKRDCASAAQHFQQARQSISSQPEGLAMYGKCLATLGRYEEAIPVLVQALSLDSTKQGARYNLALCQWNTGRNKDALESLQPLVSADHDNEWALELAAGINESISDTQTAIDLLRKAILAYPKSPSAYLQFAELSYEHGSPQIGIDFLNAGLTQLPNEARLYLVRGVLYCQSGEFTKAFDDFQAANRLDPRLSYSDIAKGIVESQVNKPNEALTQFRAAAKENPNEPLTQYLLAEALSHQEKPEVAEEIAAANRAIRLDPKLIAAQDLLAGIYLQQGEKRLAIDHSQAALAVDPNDQQALYHLILALRESDRKGEIPALMSRMSELREAERAKQGESQKRLHQLYEPSETP